MSREEVTEWVAVARERGWKIPNVWLLAAPTETKGQS